MSFEASTRRFENTSRATSESFLSARDLLDLASVLQCPISGSKLHVLSPAEIAPVRSRLARGELAHAAGAPVQMEIDQALASEDGELIYPIADGILILVPAFAIVKPGSAPRFEADAAGVMRFYDEIGWNVTDEGVFEDTVRFEDLREITRPYVKASYARVGSIIEGSGKYLLDVACGPIPYAEYYTYSESYGKRLCVDLSVLALRAARKRLRRQRNLHPGRHYSAAVQGRHPRRIHLSTHDLPCPCESAGARVPGARTRGETRRKRRGRLLMGLACHGDGRPDGTRPPALHGQVPGQKSTS